jgi:hypothetical protein
MTPIATAQNPPTVTMAASVAPGSASASTPSATSTTPRSSSHQPGRIARAMDTGVDAGRERLGDALHDEQHADQRGQTADRPVDAEDHKTGDDENGSIEQCHPPVARYRPSGRTGELGTERHRARDDEHGRPPIAGVALPASPPTAADLDETRDRAIARTYQPPRYAQAPAVRRGRPGRLGAGGLGATGRGVHGPGRSGPAPRPGGQERRRAVPHRIVDSAALAQGLFPEAQHRAKRSQHVADRRSRRCGRRLFQRRNPDMVDPCCSPACERGLRARSQRW